jgi:hypothetical protein
MDLGLNNQQKEMALRNSKAGITTEIYNILIRIGIDPDTFASVDELPVSHDGVFAGEYGRVKGLVSALELIESKLDELQ